MTITDIRFDPSPAPTKRNPRNTLYQLRRKIVFQRYNGLKTGDELHGHPYNDYQDYLVGIDGTGIDADIQTPNPGDVIIAGQMQEILTHSILVRYDSRIDPRMIIKYTNQDTGVSRYWYIVTLTNPDFEWHYWRIGAVEIVEFDDEGT